MKTKQLFYAILFFVGLSMSAQQAPFMVCSPDGTTCAPYSTLTAAYSAANNGDYIYLPAGDFTLDVYVNKVINFIGAGFDINSSVTTGITRISGNIYLNGGAANGSSFEGFYLVGSFVNVGTISDIKFSYLNFNSIVYRDWYNYWVWNNCIIKNCVVRDSLNFGHDYGATPGSNNLVMNSFVNGFKNMTHSNIKNCVVGQFGNAGYGFYRLVNTVVKNCVIESQGLNSTANYTNDVLFLNNATTVASGQLANNYSGSTEINNTYGITASDTFVTATGFTYDQTKDYHIKTTSPAHNGGDDGKDIGIYGGSTPWREGAIPSNPHIFFKNIATSTDTNGNLPVQIKVSTQY